MTTQALYLKWRSQTFEEVIGQEHVTRTLRHALERGKIAHAYLFCGPRGTGKTSTARILAKAVNCLSEGESKPCNHCDVCVAINEGRLLDLIEIDAASNTGVDDVRELRDKIGFRPGVARYKVYIIDEVHMLSNAAFNALLKTLEEPPAHVIFILATTEPQRILPTVISRCQRFDFRFVPTSEIRDHLRKIAEAEGMKIEKEALELIAAHAGGAVRDAVTLLDQLTAYGDDGITAQHVQDILGLSSMDTVGDFAEAVLSHDLSAGLGIIGRLVDQGAQLRQFNSDLLEYLRGMLLAKAGGDLRLLPFAPDVRRRLAEQAGRAELSDLVRAARLFSEAAQGLRTGLQPQLPLELALIEAASKPTAPAAPPRPAPAPASRPAPAAAPATPTPTRAAEPAPQPLAAGGELTLDDIRARWAEILRQVRPLQMDAEALLRSAQPAAVEGNVVIVAFKTRFHKERFESQSYGALVSDVIGKMVGRPVGLRCQLEAASGAEPRKPAAVAPSHAKASAAAPAAKPADAAAAADPLVQSLVELGGRVRRVTPRASEPEEPPALEEPDWDEQ